MYNTVKRHEVYLGRTKHLRGGATTPTTPQKGTPSPALNSSFKPRFQKTMAFVAAPIEESDSTPADSGLGASEESASNADLASDDHSGLYIPDFLSEANDGEWGLTIRMARAIQVDEHHHSLVLSGLALLGFLPQFPHDQYLLKLVFIYAIMVCQPAIG